jgi:tRNA dimethylallyltransferase
MTAIEKPKIIIIVGPTASGKTSLALEIARSIPSEIISADSRQVYRHLNIGTAKPSPEELESVPHHCIDIRDPDQSFNAGDFQTIARNAIADVIGRNKVPIVCGGTGLYVRALVDGFFEQPEFSGEIRKMLEDRIESEGKEALYRELKHVDPVSAATMDATKYRRVVRALEVFHETGIPISQFHAGHKKDDIYNALWIGLHWDRTELYRRINTRVDAMITSGFLDEARHLQSLGYDDRLQALQTVGYKEAFQFLRNEVTQEQMIDRMKQNTRRFAKRQLTWFRKEERIRWHDGTAVNKIRDVVMRSAGHHRS